MTARLQLQNFQKCSLVQFVVQVAEIFLKLFFCVAEFFFQMLRPTNIAVIGSIFVIYFFILFYKRTQLFRRPGF